MRANRVVSLALAAGLVSSFASAQEKDEVTLAENTAALLNCVSDNLGADLAAQVAQTLDAFDPKSGILLAALDVNVFKHEASCASGILGIPEEQITAIPDPLAYESFLNEHFSVSVLDQGLETVVNNTVQQAMDTLMLGVQSKLEQLPPPGQKI